MRRQAEWEGKGHFKIQYTYRRCPFSHDFMLCIYKIYNHTWKLMFICIPLVRTGTAVREELTAAILGPVVDQGKELVW